MNGRLMSMLVVPTQSSSPNRRPITPNGRPATWSLSAQRKMARLYLYTTLPVEKIRAIINAHSPDRTIRQSSANKRLQLLFDKEPRWLHPHDVEDMGRRVTELANSSTQLFAASEMRFPAPRKSQEQSPVFGRSDGLSSPSDECSESTYGSDAFAESQTSLPFFAPDMPEESPSVARGNPDGLAGADQSDGPFASFLHRTTFMTESSVDSTGTFREHLRGYAEPYVQVVKRLVKRFTAPALGQPGMSRSQVRNAHVVLDEDWIGDGDTSPSFFGCVPLPGESLQVEFDPGSRGSLNTPTSRRPQTGAGCLRTPSGSSAGAQWDLCLTGDATADDFAMSDCFRNTVLHFLAVRGQPDALIQALESGRASKIINAQNTAGQTFLHLLNVPSGWPYYKVWLLVKISWNCGFDMHARDCYGRTVLHTLTELGVPLRQSLLRGLDPRRYLIRDAFGAVPSVEQNSWLQQWASEMGRKAPCDVIMPALDPENSGNPAISRESKNLQNIRVSFTNPRHEDAFGHNGLHCLAMATLSLATMAEKHNLKELMQQFGIHRKRNLGDSSKDRLMFRQSMLSNLLSAGLDPNHRDLFGNTPLMAFAATLPEDDEYKTGPAMLKMLIQGGADVNARNRAGDTALHVAVRFHRKLAVRALVEEGANVHVRNLHCQSLLDECDYRLAGNPGDYAKYSACRAWLSGQAGAVQIPELWRQWMVDKSPVGGATGAV
ncbi:ankyrin repeat [Trichoderma cornu-damae]|uniref:Ankyrin repeat n=1 Tax=Trichoderma cornu-damae TaxID=654480 RepID=A0A9P8TYA5_9HYPO|nr:ankyrin repeat [Trichoderma cornu-damae]